jgi:hypothetical protein
MDLKRIIKINQPTVRVSYDFDVDLAPLVEGFLSKKASPSAAGSIRGGNKHKKK